EDQNDQRQQDGHTSASSCAAQLPANVEHSALPRASAKPDTRSWFSWRAILLRIEAVLGRGVAAFSYSAPAGCTFWWRGGGSAHASAWRTMASSESCSGTQPKTRRIRSEAATTVAGSPARRALMRTSKSCPAARLTASITSRTEKPWPYPQLKISLSPPARRW